MILEKIVRQKRVEIAVLRRTIDTPALNRCLKALPPVRNFKAALKRAKIALIAEVKKGSPSAGTIRRKYTPARLARQYEKAGAAAISVLTDAKFFQGKLSDLRLVKQAVKLPVLRKDFILDESQVYESRLAGADAVLLIVRLLPGQKLARLYKLAGKLGLACLVETRSSAEVKRALELGAEIIGINNRNLDTLKVDLKTTSRLMKAFPSLKKRLVVAESGIKTAKQVGEFRRAGVKAILVGESLLRSGDIKAKIKELAK